MAKPLFGTIFAFVCCFGVVKYNVGQYFHCFLGVFRASQQPQLGFKMSRKYGNKKLGRGG
jgi:hypothetical protein